MESRKTPLLNQNEGARELVRAVQVGEEVFAGARCGQPVGSRSGCGERGPSAPILGCYGGRCGGDKEAAAAHKHARLSAGQGVARHPRRRSGELTPEEQLGHRPPVPASWSTGGPASRWRRGARPSVDEEAEQRDRREDVRDRREDRRDRRRGV